MWYSVRSQLAAAVKGTETTPFWLFLLNFRIKKKKSVEKKFKKKKKKTFYFITSTSGLSQLALLFFFISLTPTFGLSQLASSTQQVFFQQLNQKFSPTLFPSPHESHRAEVSRSSSWSNSTICKAITSRWSCTCLDTLACTWPH